MAKDKNIKRSVAQCRGILEVLLKGAFEMQPVPKSGHIYEDEELLTCWSRGLLSRQQIDEQILAHLGICPLCRHEIIEMIDCGVIDFTLPVEETDEGV